MSATSGGAPVGGGGGNIKVVVRVRPFNSRETGRNAKCVVSMEGKQTVLSPPPPDAKNKPLKAATEGNKTFAFDKSYWSFDKNDKNYAGQDDLFKDLGKPLLDNAFGGYNNCIFAYGQTGSGKSYSMMGYGPDEGVIPRICRDMFERIQVVQEDKNMACTVEVSYLEIYNERVRDLLNPSTKGNLKVREHPATGPYVEDLAKLIVQDFKGIDHLMDEGNKARTVAATNMNETSSRSHAVFTLTLTQKRHDEETKMDTEKVAKISLVDLAGSERATSTGATGARLKEGAEINRSLSTLGRVIAALADLSTGKKKGNVQVPYRDSVLTWLLKDSLGGNSMTAMIAAISPADINFEETLSTLRYADSAKRIKNHAVVNEDPNARMIRELKEELAQLRSKLGSGGNIPSEQYAADVPLDQQFVTITQADGSTKKVSKAEIAEQLSQSEKLYKDLNETWEEKLTRTEHIHKEREAALEELGISIEKGNVGLSTPKKMPHLVNLSDDALLAECLVYNLKPGTTTVGNVDSIDAEDEAATSLVDIRLNGSKILADHCTFENVDGVVTLVPKDGAAIMVNGTKIEAPTRLRSGFRVILGDFHIFRFNHPQEAREERMEHGSLLKYSLTADQVGSPSGRPNGHERTSSSVSRPLSDLDGDGPGSGTESPMPSRGQGRDSDWSFARREAISSVLGSDQKISALTDDELDTLFEDLQKVRAVRKSRPESKLFDTSVTHDEDTDSVNSHPVREKYMSNGTLDNFSLDTALTIPSTPRKGDEEEQQQQQQQLKQMRDELQEQLEHKKEDYGVELQETEQHGELADFRAEKAKMEEDLRQLKEQMQRALVEQKAEFAKQLAQARMPKRPHRRRDGTDGLDEHAMDIAKHVSDHWRHQRYVAMAATALRNTSALKEAQVMSQQLQREIVFQFTVVDVGHTFGSSYDLVLHGLTADETGDTDLEDAIKPCLAVRVVDFKHSVIQLWSMQKLHARLRQMRQMVQYLDRPEYLEHFEVGSAFDDDCIPEYSRIGDADIPLAAVFECRVQDFNLDVISPYTTDVIGIVSLSLEPSSAEAPSSTLKFNVVMHEMVGFAEREGTNVHAQLFIPGVSEEDGATTTSLVSGFEEGPIRFESVHSMSLPLIAPHESSLRVSIFAKVTSMHLDKLLSWDDIREPAARPKSSHGGSRLPEHEYYAKERHDVFARVQVLEIGEGGEYEPTEVVQNSTLDGGAYQLHQGLQRRIVLHLTHSSSSEMPFESITDFRAGEVHLLDKSGNTSDLDSGSTDVLLTPVGAPTISTNSEGSTNIKLVGQWDSSAHGSVLLDKPTIENYRVQLRLKWKVVSPRVTRPMDFHVHIAVQTRPRTWFRQNSLLAQLWQNTRVVHSSATNYSITLKPSEAKAAGDLWRMDTTSEYISGEEMLTDWKPRGISLIRDYVRWRRRKRRIAEIEAAHGLLAFASTLAVAEAPAGEYNPSQRALLEKCLALWTSKPSDGTMPLLGIDIESSQQDASVNGSTNGHVEQIPLAAVIEQHTKNPSMLKAGWLLSPDASGGRWVRRYVELRRPYLHLYSSEGDEITAINLTNSRIDAKPQVAKLLQRDNVRLEVWAVYTTNKAWLFACRNDKERGEWIWAVDRSYMSHASSDTTPENEAY